MLIVECGVGKYFLRSYVSKIMKKNLMGGNAAHTITDLKIHASYHEVQ